MVEKSKIPSGKLLFVGSNDVVDFDGQTKRLSCSLVIQFGSAEDMRKALELGSAEFSWPGDDEKDAA